MTFFTTPAGVFLTGDDGSWRRVGEPVSMSLRYVEADGSLTTPPGTCPQCCTVPLNDEPHICAHGVTLPGLPGGVSL